MTDAGAGSLETGTVTQYSRRMRLTQPRLYALFGLCLTLMMGMPNAAATEVKQLRSTSKADATRIVLEMSAVPDYRKFHLTNPDRMVVDLRATSAALPDSLLNFSDPLVKGIRAGRRNDGVRLVFDLAGDFPSKTFTLDGPPRLVIDLAGAPAVVAAPSSQTPVTNAPAVSDSSTDSVTAVVTPAATPTPTPTPQGTRDIIVAIDAGHGGKDQEPGQRRHPRKRRGIANCQSFAGRV